MKKGGAFLSYLIFVALILFLYFQFNPEQPIKEESITPTENVSLEEKRFIINKGDGLKEITIKLKEQGIIKNEFFFQAYAFLSNARDNFLPGEYDLPKEISLKSLLSLLSTSPLAAEKTITIIEGWDNKKIALYLEENDLINQNDFFEALNVLNADEDFLHLYNFLPKNISKLNDLEIFQGYLFPDTYRFYEETTAQAIIEKMIDNFAQKLDAELIDGARKLGKTIPEIITLASLVEKEAALDQDRRLIADIFWDRIKINWALESCATINYILGNPKERLSFEDTRIPSVYNTYLHAGLPPGPINSPGLSSIRAVIYPLENDYCCFLSTPEGRIIFSKTIEEHNRNKRIYLQ